MKYFTTLFLIIPTLTQSNTIELQVQSKYHSTLEMLFHSKFHPTLPIDVLGLSEGEEAEFAGTCFSYIGEITPESIKVRLLKQPRCASPGVLFEQEAESDRYCSPASIAVTADGYESKRHGKSIKATTYKGGRYIVHEKYPQVTREESIYCYYPITR